MTINDDILDRTISHMVWTERYKTSEARRIVALLNKADNDLVEQIAARMTRIEARGFDLGEATTKRLNDLLKAIREQRQEVAESLYAENRDELFKFAQYEPDFQARAIEAAVKDAGVDIAMVRPSASQLRAVVTSRPFQGRLLKDWYADLGEASAKRVSDALKIGITQGQTTDQIVRRIKGTRANKYKDGIMEIDRRHANTIVRTAISHVTNRATDDLYEANADIIKGVKFNAVLDSRTTPICRSLDGKIYKLGQKRPVLPLHFGERSRYIPYLGKSDIRGIRASQVGEVPDDLDYGEWLRGKGKELQPEALGEKRAKLFREGNYTMDKFVDPTGKAYTLEELKARDLATWNKVFN